MSNGENHNGSNNYDSYELFESIYGADALHDDSELDARSVSGQGGSRGSSGTRQGGSRNSSGTRQGGTRTSSGTRQGSQGKIQNTKKSTSPKRTSQTNNDEEKYPITFYLGIAITIITVIILIISIIINSNKPKHRQSGADDYTSDSDITDAMIVDVSEDPEEIDEDVSSQIAYKSFVGTWYKADVEKSQKAILTVTSQFQDGFEFKLEIWNGSESTILKDTAFYSSDKSSEEKTFAEFSPKKKTTMTFIYSEDNIVISHTGKNSAYGINDKFMIDGKFTADEPEYSENTVDTKYDFNLYKSDLINSTLKDNLSAEDYELYQNMMKNGLKSPIDYERTTDVNGNLVNVDSELNAVKYYAYLSDLATDMIFICTDDGMFYLLFYNSEEVIYCSNDSNYSANMPQSFQSVAKTLGIKPTFR